MKTVLLIDNFLFSSQNWVQLGSNYVASYIAWFLSPYMQFPCQNMPTYQKPSTLANVVSILFLSRLLWWKETKWSFLRRWRQQFHIAEIPLNIVV